VVTNNQIQLAVHLFILPQKV